MERKKRERGERETDRLTEKGGGEHTHTHTQSRRKRRKTERRGEREKGRERQTERERGENRHAHICMHTQTGRVYFQNHIPFFFAPQQCIITCQPYPILQPQWTKFVQCWNSTYGLSTFRSESSPDSYVSTLSCPSPSVNCVRCCVLSVSGFLTPAATKWLLNKVR